MVHRAPSADWTLAAARTSQATNFKPSGLWLAFPVAGGDTWSEWCGDNNFTHRCGQYPHAVEVDISRLVVVRRPDDLPGWAADKKVVARNRANIDDPDSFGQLWPNWRVPAADYAGVLFPDYDRWVSDSISDLWWSTIDTSSACVWDTSAARQV